MRSPRASVRGAVADGKAQRSLALASPVRRGEAGGWRRDGAVIESGHSSGIVIVGKAKTMGRNHISKLARRILAVGIVSCFPGCGSFETRLTRPPFGLEQRGSQGAYHSGAGG